MKDPEEKTLAIEKSQKKYKTPSLTEHGDIRELTAAGSSGRREWFTWGRPDRVPRS